IMHQQGGYPAVTAWNSPQTWEYFDWCKNNLGGSGQPAWGNYNDGFAATRLATFWTYPPTYSYDDPYPTVQPAHSPIPADGASGVSISQGLSWASGAYATSHNVYFGTTSQNLSLIDNRAVNTYSPTLAYSTTYYWRIDELGDGEQEIVGTQWSFTTQDEPPPPRPKSILIRIGGQQ
ncbi:MAG TPA: hypothetical protein VLM89_13150, partial [Phycisphaerae bacterium]|nr:hypothetical protein [Phycisphaerae bacterium]